MDLLKVLESGDVLRFHAVAGISKQTLSQHQWGVAVLCMQFAQECGFNSGLMVQAALVHDCAEIDTGDIPATTKWKHPKLKEIISQVEIVTESNMGTFIALTKEEHAFLKVCDYLDGMRYCLNRYKMGEMEASTIFKRWQKYISENIEIPFPMARYYRHLLDEMDTVGGNHV